MLINITIFFVALFFAFGMLTYRAWELKTSRVTIDGLHQTKSLVVPFRRIEKIFLYIAKHLIQSFLVFLAKYWFIISIKIKKKFDQLWPKIHAFLIRKKITSQNRNLFIKRAIFESKVKIRRIKEKVKRENQIK
jgi:hypothetical protein